MLVMQAPQCGNTQLLVTSPARFYCAGISMISSGAAALGGCFAACHADSSCEYFGLETVPNQCCNKLSEVLLEVGKFGLSLRFRGLR